MGSGSYSFAAYSCLANEREYSTKSADAVFKNRSLSAKSAANRALVAAGLTPAERAEWDYKTAVGVAQALAESKVSWVPSVMFGGNGSSNSAMDAVGLKMLLDITKSFDKTSK